MPVRLLKPYNGQNANTLYYGSDMALLLAEAVADDKLGLAVDFPAYKAQLQGQILINSGLPAGNVQLGVGQNLPQTSLLRTRTAFGRVLSGTGNAIIACLGDSNTRGTGSSTTPALQGQNGWPNQLARLLKRRGIPAFCDNFFGPGGQGPALISGGAYDSRIVMSRAAIAPAAGTGVKSIGGGLFNMTQTGDTITFTPQDSINTFDIYWYSGAASQQFSYAVDGGAATTLTGSGGTSNFVKTTVAAGSVAAHSLVLSWVAGAPYVLGVDAYDSTTPHVRIWNWGWHGSSTADWTSGQTANPPAVPASVCIPGFFKPDLVIGPALGTNDVLAGLSDAQTTANLTSLIQAIQASSDVLMLTPGPAGATSSAPTVVNAVNDHIAVAQALGLPLANEYNWMGQNEANAETLGLYSTADHLHKTGAGHAVTAKQIDSFLAMIG